MAERTCIPARCVTAPPAEEPARRPRFLIPAYDTAAVTDDYRKLYYPDDRANLEPIVAALRLAAEAHPSGVCAEERLCVEIMRYTTSSMALGAPPRLECASATLAGALSSCGGYAMVMCELARVAGFPSRYLGLFGIPSTGSHALTEIHYGGEWHLFDPTFGIFFYSQGAWDGSGHVLSAHDIVAQDQRATMIQVVEKPWAKDYEKQKSFAVQPLLDPPTSHVMTYWSEAGRRSMFPVAFGNDAIISVPVDVDLAEKDRFVLGTPTGQWLDTWLQCIDNPRNGYFFLGGTCPTIHHFVRIKVRPFTRVTVRYTATPESEGRLGVFPLCGCLLASNRVEGLVTTLEFDVNASDPAFLLMAEGNYWIDTLTYEIAPREKGQGPCGS